MTRFNSVFSLIGCALIFACSAVTSATTSILASAGAVLRAIYDVAFPVAAIEIPDQPTAQRLTQVQRAQVFSFQSRREQRFTVRHQIASCGAVGAGLMAA